MKAILDKDIIVHITEMGDTEIGPLPKGVGLERLRFDGEKVVDLAQLDEMWVEEQNGAFILHAVEVKGAQRVRMTYRDRKRLVKDQTGAISVATEEELLEKAARHTDIKQFLFTTDIDAIQSTIDMLFPQLTVAQRASLKLLYKSVLWLARRDVR